MYIVGMYPPSRLSVCKDAHALALDHRLNEWMNLVVHVFLTSSRAENSVQLKVVKPCACLGDTLLHANFIIVREADAYSLRFLASKEGAYSARTTTGVRLSLSKSVTEKKPKKKLREV